MAQILIDIVDSRTGEVYADLVPLSEVHELCLDRGWVHDSTTKTELTTVDNDIIYKFLVYVPETPEEVARFEFQARRLMTWENRCSARRLA